MQAQMLSSKFPLSAQTEINDPSLPTPPPIIDAGTPMQRDRYNDRNGPDRPNEGGGTGANKLWTTIQVPPLIKESDAPPSSAKMEKHLAEAGTALAQHLACGACRTRKVRCDGGRPSCSSCRKRHSEANCSYDITHKRRGPDKKPGRKRRPSGILSSAERSANGHRQTKRNATPNLRSNVTLTTMSQVLRRPLQDQAHEPRTVLSHQVGSFALETSLPRPLDAPGAVATRQLVLQPLSQLSGPSRTAHLQSADPASSPQRLSPHGNLNIHPSIDTRFITHQSISQVPKTLSGDPPHFTPQNRDTWSYSNANTLPPSAGSVMLRNSYRELSQVQARSEAHQQPWPPNISVLAQESSARQQWNQYHNSGFSNSQGSSYVFSMPDDVPLHMFLMSSNSIIREPSLSFSRETWWDNVLNIYSIQDLSSLSTSFAPPWSSPSNRQAAADKVQRDIYTFFMICPTWVSFINVPMFLSTFHQAEYRAKMQPALLLGVLACSTLLQTSHPGGEEPDPAIREEKERIWMRSAILRELAQAAFEASYNAGWIDMYLAEAAWILASYELSAHRDLTSQRMESSMILLDNVIRVLGLTRLDAGNPRAPVFAPGAVPALGRPLPAGQTYYPSCDHGSPASSSSLQSLLQAGQPSRNLIHYQPTTQPTPFDLCRAERRVVSHPHSSQSIAASGQNLSVETCPCHALSLAGSPEAQKCTPLWLSTPQWDPGASLAELQREESRRLVWASVMMFGSDAAARLALGMPQLDLHTAKPENFALLYPGEEVYAYRPELDAIFSGKESTWALYSRTMHLWSACVKQIAEMRRNSRFPGRENIYWGLSFSAEELAAAGQDKADFAMRAWMETLAIEQALNDHTCDGEKGTMYQAREYLFAIRMFISGGFRQYIPQPQSGVDFSRLDHHKAMHWLNHQHNVATQVRNIIATDSQERRMLSKRPHLIWWQMAIIGRSLQLWKLDNSLTFAVDVASKVVPILNWFEKTWPCPEQQRRASMARGQLEHVLNLLGRQMPI
ncbi:hypothetical protein FRB93_000714 [Tulasnella sp. JGI-2019a]|nr:hypothetical protein FRB93_000714 [Tulasnella sp. JGI-2019a]